MINTYIYIFKKHKHLRRREDEFINSPQKSTPFPTLFQFFFKPVLKNFFLIYYFTFQCTANPKVPKHTKEASIFQRRKNQSSTAIKFWNEDNKTSYSGRNQIQMNVIGASFIGGKSQMSSRMQISRTKTPKCGSIREEEEDEEEEKSNYLLSRKQRWNSTTGRRRSSLPIRFGTDSLLLSIHYF